MSDRTVPFGESIAALPTISLLELQEVAPFLVRTDRKYLLPAAGIPALIARLGGPVRVLEITGRREFGYETRYFDDEGMTAYLLAARRRRYRFKVRTRLYTDTGLCHLEVKVRDRRGRTVKRRIDHDPGHHGELCGAERSWLAEIPDVAPYAARLGHCLTTYYTRTSLVLGRGEGRMTIDRDLVFALPDGSALSVPSLAIVETKGPGRPTWADRALWERRYRPLALSKFAVGLSLLVPDIPANRWHRIRRELSAAAERADLASCRGVAVPSPAEIRLFAD